MPLTKQSPFRKILLPLFALLLASFTLTIWHYQVPPFNFISLKLNDLNFSLNDRSPSDDIIFIAIDEKSVNQFGRWPWDRETLASILDRLSPAKVVALDIIFSEPSNDNADSTLAQSIQQNSTVCSFFFRNESTQEVDEETRWLMSNSALERIKLDDTTQFTGKYIETNIPSIMEACSANAAISTIIDADTLVRKYPLTLFFDHENFASLGVQTLRLYRQKELFVDDATGSPEATFNNKNIPIDKNALAHINYYQPQSYNVLSVTDFMAQETTSIKNKIVILGISEAGLTDVRSTPIGNLSGPLIHYTFISNVLDGTLLKTSNSVNYFSFFLLFIIPLVIKNIFKHIVSRSTVYLSSIFIFFAATKILYIYGHFLIETFYPIFGLALMAIAQEIHTYRKSELENKLLTAAFESYVSPEILNELKHNHETLSLGGTEREITVLFCDIRSFTTLSEKLESSAVVELLTQHFEPLTKEIINNKGTLDKYIGDAIMALFNAPIEISNHPMVACRVALNMLKITQEKKLSNQANNFDVGIGISSGPAIIGNMGSSLRFNYTAIGDTVNVASRLEGLCKIYKAPIIVSENTAKMLDDTFLFRFIEKTALKGRHASINIFELMEDSQQNRALKSDFESAMEEFKLGEHTVGKKRLKKCINVYNDDVSRVMLEKYNTSHK